VQTFIIVSPDSFQSLDTDTRPVYLDFLSTLSIHYRCIDDYSRLGGVVVSVLATGPKGCWFKPGQGDGFLRAIKIRSTPSFGWEIKPEGPMS
jgi:hypothetical protein